MPGPKRSLLDNRLFRTRVWILDSVSSQSAETDCLGCKKKEDGVGAFDW